MDCKINWEFIHKDRIKRKIEKAALGREDIECKYCNGTGIEEEGFRDHDAHGSFWVSSISCKHCCFGQVEVKIDKARQKLALKQLLKELEDET